MMRPAAVAAMLSTLACAHFGAREAETRDFTRIIVIPAGVNVVLFGDRRSVLWRR